jgi:hypothetical protein
MFNEILLLICFLSTAQLHLIYDIFLILLCTVFYSFTRYVMGIPILISCHILLAFIIFYVR